MCAALAGTRSRGPATGSGSLAAPLTQIVACPDGFPSSSAAHRSSDRERERAPAAVDCAAPSDGEVRRWLAALRHRQLSVRISMIADSVRVAPCQEDVAGRRYVRLPGDASGPGREGRAPPTALAAQQGVAGVAVAGRGSYWRVETPPTARTEVDQYPAARMPGPAADSQRTTAAISPSRVRGSIQPATPTSLPR